MLVRETWRQEIIDSNITLVAFAICGFGIPACRYLLVYSAALHDTPLGSCNPMLILSERPVCIQDSGLLLLEQCNLAVIVCNTCCIRVVNGGIREHWLVGAMCSCESCDLVCVLAAVRRGSMGFIWKTVT